MIYDCRTCGACCVSDWDTPTYVTLSPLDVRRMSRRSQKLHVLPIHAMTLERDPSDMGLRTKHTDDGCVCIALRGRVGVAASCGIYEKRPDACRLFSVAGRGCTYARQQAGLPVVQDFSYDR